MHFRWRSSRRRRASQEVHNASIGIVDEDHSELSRRIARLSAALFPDAAAGRRTRHRPADEYRRYTFVVDIPPNFERDVLGGRQPAVQVNVDATAMVQAGRPGYAQQIITTEIPDFLSRSDGAPPRRSIWPSASRTTPISRPPGSERDGHHQQCHHAGDHPGWRRHRARARARHHGPSAGDAAVAIRDRDVEGLGERPGDHRCGRTIALFGRAVLLHIPIAGSIPLFLRASRSICFSLRQWASSSAPWRARCRSSACCTFWCICR